MTFDNVTPVTQISGDDEIKSLQSPELGCLASLRLYNSRLGYVYSVLVTPGKRIRHKFQEFS